MKTILFVLAMMISVSSYGATKCEPDGKGGVCCWDTEKDGPFKPFSCM